MDLLYSSIRKVVKRLSPSQWLYLTGVLVLPFIYNPWTSVPFEIPRVYFFQRWVEALVITTLLFSKQYPVRFTIKKYTVVFLLLLIGSMFIASFTGADLSKSIQGNYYRGDGLMTYIHLVTFFLITLSIFDKKFIIRILQAIGASSVLISILSIGFFLYYGKPPSLTFGNSRFLASYLVLSFPALFIFQKIPRLLLMVIQSIAIVCTLSVGGGIGLVLAWVAYIVWFVKKQSALFLLFVLITAVLTAVLYFSFDTRQTDSFESRKRIFTKGILAWQQRPLLGWGLANFDYAFESVVWPIKNEQDIYVDKAHASLLEVLVTTGILGVFSYLIFTGNVMVKALHAKSPPLIITAIMFVLYLFVSQTNILSISSEIFYWLGAAVLLLLVY